MQEEKGRQILQLEEEVDAANKRFYSERKCVLRSAMPCCAVLSCAVLCRAVLFRVMS